MPVWTWIGRIAASAAVGTVIVGALHMPFARPLLARIAGCPLERVTPEQVEVARAGALRRLRGTQVAPARPALGFALESTSLAGVRTWAASHGVSCEESRKGTLLKCTQIPAGLVAPGDSGVIDEIAFGFRVADHVLTNVTTLRTGIDAASAAALLADASARLRRDLGTASAERLPGRAWDATGPAFVSYRFSDYLAEASAMRVPERGVVLREQYVSADERRTTGAHTGSF